MKNYFKTKYFLLAGAVLAGLLLIKQFSNDSIPEEVKKESHQDVDTAQVKPITLKYGFDVDEFELEESKVKKNQSLSTILRQYDVSFATIDR
jgi:hypothetical protein